MKTHKLPFVALVNNAAIALIAPVESSLLKNSRELFETNFFGTLALTQKFLPTIRENFGRVIFISSGAGFLSAPGTGIYAAAKHALEATADSLRLEMEDFGVSGVNFFLGN